MAVWPDVWGCYRHPRDDRRGVPVIATRSTGSSSTLTPVELGPRRPRNAEKKLVAADSPHSRAPAFGADRPERLYPPMQFGTPADRDEMGGPTGRRVR